MSTTAVKPVTVQGQFVQVDYDKAKPLGGYGLYSEISKVCIPNGQKTDVVDFIRGKTQEARELGWWDKIKETLRIFTKTKLRKFVDFVLRQFGGLKETIREAAGTSEEELKQSLDLKGTIDSVTGEQKGKVRNILEEALKGLSGDDADLADMSTAVPDAKAEKKD